MLCANETVTVIRCDGEVYTATLYSGASWFEKTGVVLADKGLVSENSVRVRIPAASFPSGAALPVAGDHILRGALPFGRTVQSPADLAVLGARRIMAVGDNRRGGIPHVAVIAE